MNELNQQTINSEINLLAILRSTYTGFIKITAGGKFIEVNDAYCTIIGYNRDELLTKTIFDVEVSNLIERQADRILKVKEKGYDFFDVQHRCKDGKELDFELCALYENNGTDTFAGFLRVITDRKLLENELKFNERRMESLYQLNQMSSQKEESELIGYALEEAVVLTGSKIGYFHFLNPDQKTIQLFKWSSETLLTCTAINETHYPISSAGIWADSVRQKKPIIHNDYEEALIKNGLPEGHVSLQRHLGIPIIEENGNVVIIIGVGNKEKEYTDQDVKQIELIMDGLWKIIKKKRSDESTLKFQYILEQSPTSIVITDTNGIIEYVNTKFTQITGYSSEEAIGNNPRLLKSGEMSAKEYKDLWQKITNGFEWHGELHNKKKNGELYWESASISPIKNAKGQIINFLAIKEDITERKRMEEAIIETNEKFKTIFDSSNDAIMLLSQEGFFDCNRRALEIFGIKSKEEFVKFSPAELSPPVQHNGEYSKTEADKNINIAFHKGSNRFEWIHRRANGEDFPAEVLLSAFDYRGKRVLQATVREITERKRAEEALNLSEEQFRAIWNTSVDGLRLTDKEGKIIMVNDAFCDQIGKTHTEMKGHFLDVMYEPVEGKRILSATIENFHNNTIAQHLERQVTLWNYRKVWFELSNSVITLSSGNNFLLSIFRDITEKKQVEIELNRSHEFLRSTISSIDDLVFVLNVNGEFIDFYQPAKEIVFELPKKHFIDNHYSNVGFPDYLVRLLDKEVEYAKTTMETQQFDYYLQLPTGVNWYSAKLSIRKNTLGEFDGVTIVCRDISERIEQENNREQLTEELRLKNNELQENLAKMSAIQRSLITSEKMASIGQLTAGIAHEINNPLAFVSSNINRFGEYYQDVLNILNLWKSTGKIAVQSEQYEQIKQQALQLEQQNDLQFITEDFPHLLKTTREGVERIKKIVEQLRGFTHMADSQFSSTDINEALENTITIVWNELKYKATVERHYGELPMIQSNTGEIKQVFVNLLVNAAHAIEHSGTITVSTEAREQEVVITISDTGSGISEDNLKKIFDPFFTTKPVGKGTGLGLWITSTIVEKHNGTITAESIVGVGTTFTLTLPVSQTKQV